MCGILDTVSKWSTKAGKWWEGVDPTTHGLFDEMIRTDNKVVREAGRNAKNNFGGTLGEWGAKLENDANKNVNNPDGAVGKAALVAAAIMGGASAAGGSSGAAAGEAGAAGASGEAAAGAGAGYGSSDAAYLAAADEAGGMVATGGSETAAGTAGTSGGTAAKAGGDSALKTAGKSAAQAAATSAVTTLLTPKPDKPTARPVTAMPDPQAQAEARRRKLVEQLVRRGRASTIMTDSAG